MALDETLNQVIGDLRQGRFASESAVSQGVVLPVLNALGWPVFNTSVVIPEYSVQNRRVDYALCHPERRPKVFIEVKQVGHTDGADRQLFEYAFHAGVPMAILTDGQGWSFYLPAEQGEYNERRVYKLDLLERDAPEASERLIRYLDYGRMCGDQALRAARDDYRDVARMRVLRETFPVAWRRLLEEQDSLLLEMLAEKVEDISGFKPDMDACSEFVQGIVRGTATLPPTQPQALPAPQPAPPRRSKQRFSFSFKGESYQESSAKGVMIKLFQLIGQEDPEFFTRFAARPHGRRRRYIAQDRYELYPGRPDLCEGCSIEIVPGWWMGTNYSTDNIRKIIDLALDVVHPSLRATIHVQLDV